MGGYIGVYLLNMQAVMTGDDAHQLIQVCGSEDGVSDRALPVRRAQSAEQVDEALASIGKVSQRSMAILADVLPLFCPGIGILTRDEGVALVGNLLQPGIVDLSLDITQVAEHLCLAPFARFDPNIPGVWGQLVA